MTIATIYDQLRAALKKQIQQHNLTGQNISVRCKALSAAEAIGSPEHDDYPIIKGKEVMVEALFADAKGHAFTDEYENADYQVQDLLNIKLNNNRQRAGFIAGLNVVFRHLKLCDKTVHCKDDEPKKCAENLLNIIDKNQKVLLVGYQPRFAEVLTANYKIRVIDLDQDNIGKVISGVMIEPPENTYDALAWCDLILATGSTVVNGTIADFLHQNKPVIFYGVTIAAPAYILSLKTYCHCSH